jgi:DNA-binding transcriptional regulator YiaG
MQYAFVIYAQRFIVKVDDMKANESYIPISGADLRRMRKDALRLSQADLGFLLGVDQAAVSRWERTNTVPTYAAVVITGIIRSPKFFNYLHKTSGLEPEDDDDE